MNPSNRVRLMTFGYGCDNREAERRLIAYQANLSESFFQKIKGLKLMTVLASPFEKRSRGYTCVRHWFAEDGHDESLTGWYVLSIDSDGEPWDAIGPFDDEAFAVSMLGRDIPLTRHDNVHYLRAGR